LFEIGQKLAKYMFLAMNFFFWPTPSKIGQFKQKWPINWPSGIPGLELAYTKLPLGLGLYTHGI
jgi:hypothetical protein